MTDRERHLAIREIENRRKERARIRKEKERKRKTIIETLKLFVGLPLLMAVTYIFIVLFLAAFGAY